MLIYWNDGTFTRFKQQLSECERCKEIGFFNINTDGKLVLVLWANIKYIQLQ